MSRKSISVVPLALLLVLAVIATGCGSKSSATSTAAADTTSTDTTAVDTTATDTTATDATLTDTTATDTTGANAVAGLASLGNCKQLADLGNAFSAAFTGASGDTAKEAALLKEFADKTPEDIRPDFQTLAAAFAKIADALKGVDLTSGKVPDADTIAKLSKLSTEFDTPALTKAEANISAWATKNCSTASP